MSHPKICKTINECTTVQQVPYFILENFKKIIHLVTQSLWCMAFLTGLDGSESKIKSLSYSRESTEVLLYRQRLMDAELQTPICKLFKEPRAHICHSLRSQAIDSASLLLCSMGSLKGLQILAQCWNFWTIYGASNRVGKRLSYRPANLHRLAESIPGLLKSLKIPVQESIRRNRFLSSWKVYKFGHRRLPAEDQ